MNLLEKNPSTSSGADVNTRLITTNKNHRFFLCVRNGQIAVFWVFCCEINCKWACPTKTNVLNKCLLHCNIHNRLVNVCTVETCNWNRRRFLCLWFSSSYLFAGFTTYRSNLSVREQA